MQNPVLLGYWCNLFKSLVITHPKEVFMYVYEHQEIIEKMLEHLYSPQMSELIVRILNFNSNVLSRGGDSPYSSNGTPQTPQQPTLTETSAQEIRSCTVFSIIERLGPDYRLDE